MDAGGANHRVATILSKFDSSNTNSWLNGENVEFKHPCSSHTIAIYFCNVHNFKSMRNALFASRTNNVQSNKKKKRTFVDDWGIKFGWNVIENQWCREKRRKLHGCARATMLTETSVVPNCHSKWLLDLQRMCFS